MCKSKPTVVVDVDEVLLDLVGAWCRWLNAKYKTTVLSSDITQWDVTKAFPELTREQVYEPLSIPEFWDTVEPLEGAPQELEKMCEEFDLWLCTKAHLDTASFKYTRAIQKHYPFIDQLRVIIASRKQMIECDYIIDDNPRNLINHKAQRILIDAPHNKGYFAAGNDMFRAAGLRDAYDIICECEKLYCLSAAEFDACEYIARKTHMDSWFCIRQTLSEIDNLYDCENHELLPLISGIRMLAEGIDDPDIYGGLSLPATEEAAFRGLLDKIGYKFWWEVKS